MAAGVSQAWSWVKMGCAVRSCLVVFLYVLRAFSKINSKLEDDVSQLRAFWTSTQKQETMSR